MHSFANSTNLGEVESVTFVQLVYVHNQKYPCEMQYIDVCASVLFYFLHYNADLGKIILKTMWRVVLTQGH